MGKFVKECFVTKVYHFDALKNWKKLNISDKVFLLDSKEHADEVRVMLATSNGENDVKAKLFLNNVEGFENMDFANKDKQEVTISYEHLNFELPKCDVHIGNLSKEDSKSIIDVIKSGHSYIFYGMISCLDEKNEENKRIKVAIYIKEKK